MPNTNIFDNINNFIQTYETTLPFSQKKVSFRPFRVKDAKVLGLILQEDNKKLAFKNMVELLKNTTTETEIDDLCLADAEYLFLQIRSKSVDEILNLVYQEEKIQVQIADIKYRNQVAEQEISIGPNISLVLKTPTVKDLLRLETFDKQEYGKACIEKIIANGEIYKLNKFVTDDIKSAIENLPLSVLSKIDVFLKKQPELYINLQLTDEQKEVSGLLNFFTFR
jgi:hypothetical protein